MTLSIHFIVTVLSLVVPFSVAIPDGFIDEGVVARNAILTGAFAPNPRNDGKPMLLLSSKNGEIYVLEDPDNSDKDTNIFSLDGVVCTNGERGLQSMLPHPNFLENGYIYLYYSSFVDDCPEDPKTGPPNHLSRFTMDKDTLMIDMDSKEMILETSPAPHFMHNGGAMAFGNDGYIYMTIGDGGSREPAYAQDMRILYGSVIRIDENGKAPRDNPFTVESGGTGVVCAKNGGVPPKDAPDDAVCEEIFAYGLRNPFRLAMDVNTKDKVLFHVGDVGASHWEEISKGGTDYKAVNYGWPIHEGPCLLASTTDCPVEKKFTDPFYYYQHIALAEGGCVTGAAFVPDGIWPEQYKYLFVDFIYGNIYNLIADPDRECRDCNPPIPAYRNETFYTRDIMVDIFFGPYKDTQALYVISRNEGQSIRRIHYSGSSNRAPIAIINTSTNVTGVGKVITFDGSQSSDADADVLSYLWEFGDGTTSNEIIVDHAFTELGQYTVTLTVVDTKNQNNQVFVVVVVGVPPVASIELPIDGVEFTVGQEFRVRGSAIDYKGVAIPDLQLTWEVRQHHGDHFHPFLESATGNNFDLDPAPAPEDFLAATNSYLEIIMHATDADGLMTTISRNVQPKKVIIDIDSNPQGLQVLVDEFGVVTPANITSWVNHKLRLNTVEQGEYNFQSWSMGGDQKTVFTVPDEQSKNLYILATFAKGSDVETAKTTTPTLAPVELKTISPTSTPFKAVETESPVVKTMTTTNPTLVPTVRAKTESPVVKPMNTAKPVLIPTVVAKTQSPTMTEIVTATPTLAPAKDDITASPVESETEVPEVQTEDDDEGSDGDDDGNDGDNDGDNTSELLPLVRPTRPCTEADPCERCEGDCNSDDDCVGDLVCFKKGKGEEGDTNVVPGCFGVDMSRTDWCTTKKATKSV